VTLSGGLNDVEPVLQAEDGSFVGAAWDDQANPYMIAFDETGSQRWSVAGDYWPKMALDGGGLIATLGYDGPAVTFDQNGAVTGQVASLPAQSWTGNAYRQGSGVEKIVNDLLFVLYDLASSFWAAAGGNYSENGAAYALIRTFQNNAANARIVVTNPSQAGPNQQTITNTLNDISQGLNSGRYAGCSAWLTGASPVSASTNINTLVTYNLYGHGSFNQNRTAAFVGHINRDGTPVGVPVTWAITVNDRGAFFNAESGDGRFEVGRRNYNGGTRRAQAAILVHELSHVMRDAGGAAGFQNDANNRPAGRANDNLVDGNCRRLIESLR